MDGDCNTTPTPPTKLFKDIEFYRKLVRTYSDRQDYGTANYWADKVVTFSNGAPQDVYAQAECMASSGQHAGAVAIIKNHNYEKSNVHFRCLAARCLYKAKEYKEALDILNIGKTGEKPGHIIRPSKWEPADPKKSILGQVHLLRGKIYEALTNREMAALSYKEALHKDPYCLEAWQILTQNQLLSDKEELSLYENIPFSRFCRPKDRQLVKYLYSLKLRNRPFDDQPQPKSSPSSVAADPSIQKNVDTLSAAAQKSYDNCDYKGAHKLVLLALKEDAFHSAAIFVYIGCLYELSHSAELFKLSHKLFRVLPESALAWYALGAYNFLIGHHTAARQNLHKGLTYDPEFGPAWLLFGHTFADENDHDQAMSAYFKATQSMKGSHLPLLHIGVECVLSNNPDLATQFFDEAKLLSPDDPYVCHELGVLEFNKQRYIDAYDLFLQALGLIGGKKAPLLEYWEPLYNNLGHVCRKLEKYQTAFEYHQKALILCPANASTYTAIGALLGVRGETESAIDWLHKACSRRREDVLTNTLMQLWVDKMADEDFSPIVDPDLVGPDDFDGSEFPVLPGSEIYRKQSVFFAKEKPRFEHFGNDPSSFPRSVEWLQNPKQLLLDKDNDSPNEEEEMRFNFGALDM